MKHSQLLGIMTLFEGIKGLVWNELLRQLFLGITLPETNFRKFAPENG